MNVQLVERMLGPAFASEPHCVYCGTSLFQSRTCVGCSDLPKLDHDWQAARQAEQMRDWWLSNYSTSEIAELAQGLDDVLALERAA